MSHAKLVGAVEAGDLHAVQKLLGKGTAPGRGAEEDGEVPLVIAVRRGHVDIVRALLAAGADPMEGYGIRSPLGSAAQTEDPALRETLLRLLVAHGARLDAPTSHDTTVLGEAAERGDTACMALLVALGASVHPPGIDASPFDRACAGRSEAAAAFLLDRGAPVNPAGDETTPLTNAILYGLDGIAERLLAVGADPTLGDGYSCPLQAAVVTGRVDWVERLVGLGASLAWTKDNGEDLLTTAVNAEKAATVALLLERGAVPTASHLVFAVVNGVVPVVDLLLPRLALSGDDATNLLVRAILWRQPALAARLLPHVGDPDRLSIDGWGTSYAGKYAGGVTPLHAAAMAGDVVTAQALVAAGATADLPLPQASRSERHSALNLPAGCTPAKAAELARKHALAERDDPKPFAAVEAWFAAAGKKAPAKPAPAKPAPAKPAPAKAASAKKGSWKEAIDDALVELARLGGNDADAAAAELAAMKAGKMSEWMYLSAAVRQCRNALLSERVVTALAGSLLLRMLQDRMHDGDEAVIVDEDDTELDGINPVYLKYYPKAARKPLELGDIVASSDADLWVMWRQPDGTTRVCHAHPESFTVLAEGIPEWLADQVGAVRG